MAIKKVVRKESTGEAKQVKKVAPVVEEVIEDVVEEVMDEEVEEEYEAMEEEDVEEEVVEVVKPKVQPKAQKKAVGKQPSAKKKTIGKKQPKAQQEEKKIGTVFPKELILKNVQAALSEEFDISLADLRKILDALEVELTDAAQVASVRFLGGILKATTRNASVNKAPKVDYYSYTGERTVLSLTGATIGKPEEYRGQKDGNVFVIEEMKDEDRKFVPAEGEIELD